jgi:methylthioribose-1-phosphate isomerase
MTNTVEWRDSDQVLLLIDQLLLPHRFEIAECRTYREAGEAIRTMQVRGAPAIGVTAAYAMALAALELRREHRELFYPKLEDAAEWLAATRPTAVNLRWAIDQCLSLARRLLDSYIAVISIPYEILRLAKQIQAEDLAACRAMGQHGAALIKDGDNVLTHCNAGGLATAGYGTAVGVITAAHEAGKNIHVWVDETRPYLQGARLTAWELVQLGIPHTLITDNMSGHLMQHGKVQFVVTGADRIASNGDTANKIGTYMVAVLAKENNIPFYIAAPLSTIDLNIESGSQIPIEERSADEVVYIGGNRLAPLETHAAHFGFDVTPARYIHGIITEKGIARPPFEQSIRALFSED